MDRLFELEQRIEEYRKHATAAEQMALQKLQTYPPFDEKSLSPVDILRRELHRHHTRILLLDEISDWIKELKGLRLYQLHTLPTADNPKPHLYNVRQYMTEKEAEEVNATFEANNEHLRWKPVELPADEEDR